VADVTSMTDTQRQALINAFLSPESVRACTVRHDSFQPNYTSVKEDVWERKSAADENIFQVSKVVVSVSGIQLPVFNLKSQVCVNSVSHL